MEKNRALTIIIVLLVLVAGWYLLSPLFLDKEVNEDFPSLDNMPNQEEIDNMSEEDRMALEKGIVEKMADMPGEAVIEDMPESNSAPAILLSGNFKDADGFHKGVGEANIYELEDGSKVLRLENFNVTNGPDLYVYLTSYQSPSNKDEVHSGYYYELSKLKGNVGNQNYEIPDEVSLDDINTVVVYCRAFHVVFSTADLN